MDCVLVAAHNHCTHDVATFGQANVLYQEALGEHGTSGRGSYTRYSGERPLQAVGSAVVISSRRAVALSCDFRLLMEDSHPRKLLAPANILCPYRMVLVGPVLKWRFNAQSPHLSTRAPCHYIAKGAM